MTFSEKFIQNFSHDFPLAAGKKIILAVSGGLDSMVMMHLFSLIGQSCEIAHCNFQLRGDESGTDEKFVEQNAKKYDFGFHSTKFFTKNYADQHKVSIQMAARTLRYEWFLKLTEELNANFIATAHHANDNAETMLLNIVKGTGLAGMHGIKAANGKIIRPLLFASRKEIELYAAQQNILWREDSSNQDDYYLRNKLRLHIMPVLEEINPEVTSAMLKHANLIRQYEILVESYMDEISGSIVTSYYEGAVQEINISRLMQTAAPEIVLYHILKHTGAGAALCEAIISNTNTGSVFYSGEYKIVRERESISLFSNSFFISEEFELSHHQQKINLPFGFIEISEHNISHADEIKQLNGFGNKESLFIDSLSVKFPLTIRKWNAGDNFQPLGMKGRKLISDFFTDSRFTSLMKETVYLLLSENEIVWVIGHRPSDIFKVKNTTTSVLQLTYHSNTVINGTTNKV